MPGFARAPSKNYGITLMDAQGSRSPVQIIFTIIPRKLIKELSGLINQYNPNAFYSIEEVKNVSHGISQPANPILRKPKMPQLWRRSK